VLVVLVLVLVLASTIKSQHVETDTEPDTDDETERSGMEGLLLLEPMMGVSLSSSIPQERDQELLPECGVCRLHVDE
jgi:hypothetical protein